MNGISPLSQGAVSESIKSSDGLLSGTSGEKTSFADVFSDAYDTAIATDSADKSSTLDLLTGNVDDLSTVLIDSEKAEVALGLTIQLRNKVMDAYNEIMNMQV